MRYPGLQVRKGVMIAAVSVLAMIGFSFASRCDMMAQSMSEPSIIIRGKLQRSLVALCHVVNRVLVFWTLVS